MDPELPQYSRSSTRPRDPRPSVGSRSSSRVSEHTYHLTDSKGRQWLSLKVMSTAPSSGYLPAFYEGDAVGGSVTLHREKEDSIKSISVQVIGQMTSSAMEVVNFLQVSETLWSSSAPSSSQDSNSGTLVGQFDWPFALTLPRQCQCRSSSGDMETYPLPGSFSERLARVHIQYQVIATVHRSRFRVDSTLGTVIGYCPIIRPDPPSRARQLAYIGNTELPGPDTDPDGWKCLEPHHIRGSVFSTRTVDARCTLALAKPLCYTRGSVIPCLLTVETTDPQALDLLSAPRSPLVRLLRQIATGEGTLRTTGGKRLPRLEFEREVQELATAVWQPDRSRQQYRRVLHGEIHLSAGLKPTCRLGTFELTYAVAVYPPRAVAFQPEGGGSTVLQQEPVVIATVYAPGPRPRINSPPGYDDASSVGQMSEFRSLR
ncbi:hypothetical protein L226DRAFT_473994 [Lentinus tigrinus ALCF2SS1-7]|uniref:Arrestin-like N-terminal domain-containing protein n=1 Tax=Lentinus tigrinus ALCF2SS1-6 TaxID=1328759 RepID=A0A5C2SAG6_9APHY|nr:hypothetical protein L227DRAFT_501557 [Lentinus tigrinus ALCF2SS1-6]RPD68060.1 hypothetical protein L226DRAFT_473994 [Lentinus tigrinus ALCF2SS1-7]